jgi:hypothetical protein
MGGLRECSVTGAALSVPWSKVGTGGWGGHSQSEISNPPLPPLSKALAS